MRKRRNGRERRTTRFVTDLAAYLHLCGKGNHRNTDAVLDTRVKSVVDIPGVAGGERPKYDDNFTRGVCGEVTTYTQLLASVRFIENREYLLHTAPSHFDGIL